MITTEITKHKANTRLMLSVESLKCSLSKLQKKRIIFVALKFDQKTVLVDWYCFYERILLSSAVTRVRLALFLYYDPSFLYIETKESS